MKGLTLSICIIASTVGLAKVGLWPIVTPKAEEINPKVIDELKSDGWNVASVDKPRLGHEISMGQSFKATLDNQTSASVTALLVPVRPRGVALLDAQKLSYLVEKRDFLGAESLNTGVDQLGVKKSADQITTVTTCLIRNGTASNNPNQLRAIIKEEPIDLLRRSRIIAGVEPPRDWSCLYVRMDILESIDSVESVWDRLKKSLVADGAIFKENGQGLY